MIYNLYLEFQKYFYQFLDPVMQQKYFTENFGCGISRQ